LEVLEGEQINRVAGEAVKWIATAHLTCNTDAMCRAEICLRWRGGMDINIGGCRVLKQPGHGT